MAATARTQDVAPALITVELTKATLLTRIQEAPHTTETTVSETVEAMALALHLAGEIL
jgi:hypothetical protein